MASGKVLLAQLDQEELERRLPATLEPTLEGKPKSRAALLRERDEIRSTGLGYEEEELRRGICAVAVAVTDAAGQAASIAVPMPTTRFHESRSAVGAALLNLRDEIQRKVRAHGAP
jgi:DNA-binding IclR family transcriptional regulator